MMEIISHRGWWQTPAEKNSVAAFERSFAACLGTETDVRDCAGRLVVSHDPPDGSELELDALLEMAAPVQPLLAINIKSDGLAERVRARMDAHGYRRWFVFDMSIPDTRQQIAAGNPVFVRMSEYERLPPFLDQAAGVWLDAFDTDGWRIAALTALRDAGTAVCLVSPELHRRDPGPFWTDLRSAGLHRYERLTLCTDAPADAASFFEEHYDQGRSI